MVDQSGHRGFEKRGWGVGVGLLSNGHWQGQVMTFSSLHWVLRGQFPLGVQQPPCYLQEGHLGMGVGDRLHTVTAGRTQVPHRRAVGHSVGEWSLTLAPSRGLGAPGRQPPTGRPLLEGAGVLRQKQLRASSHVCEALKPQCPWCPQSCGMAQGTSAGAQGRRRLREPFQSWSGDSQDMHKPGLCHGGDRRSGIHQVRSFLARAVSLL